MNQEIAKKKLSWRSYLTVGIVILIAAITQARWFPAAAGFAQKIVNSRKVETPDAHGHDAHDDHDDHGHDDHEGHDHGAHGNESASQSLELSAQARLNLGLTAEYLSPIKLQTFYRSLSMPGMIVERPGRSRIDVSAPLTGVIVEIYHEEGETVNPGEPLFKMKLTHQDLVQLQTDFLKRIGELKVDELEIDRLEEFTRSGAIPGTKLLERQYSRDKLLAELKSQRESLRLHGLSARQIQEVENSGHLLQELIVVATSPTDHQPHELRLSDKQIRRVSFQSTSKSEFESNDQPEHQPELVIQNLRVDKGETIEVGSSLCELVDYSRLYIEGMAFEGDANSLAFAMKQNWTVTAILETSQGVEQISNLDLVFISNKISQEKRTLSFYIDLPNELLRDQSREDGRRFITWRFRPGQRLQLQIPIEQWNDEFVLPVDAIAKEGAEYFVFLENGKKFDSVAVHVKYRDQVSAVIANDGSLFPGDVVALKSATRMFDAIKNKAGGGVDPHAGHSH